MRQSFNTISLLGLLGSLSAGSLTAAPREPVASFPVAVRGRIIARLYTANAGLAPSARAALASSRLSAVAARGVESSAIVTRPLGEGIGVYVRAQLVLVATPAEASTRGISPAALAERWARGLRTVLGTGDSSPKRGGERRRADRPGSARESSGAAAVEASRAESPASTLPTAVPPVNGGPVRMQSRLKPARIVVPARSAQPASAGFSTRQAPRLRGENDAPAPPLALAQRWLSVPLGEMRAVRVSGVTAALVVEGGAPAVAAEVAAGDRAQTRLLQVRGLAVGQGTVRLRMGDAAVELAVRVMPYAARLVGPVEVTVTGRPAPGAWVRECVFGRRAEALALVPGAEVRWGAVSVGDLAAGESRALSLPARVTAPDSFPVETAVTVNVHNRALPAREAALLFYSNNPERVTACVPLFLGDLDPDAPARLLYHHLNGTGRPFAFRVDVLNPDQEPAEVQVIEGSAGPSPDAVLVGHRAALRFAQSWPADVGRVVTVAPGARRAIVAQQVPDGLTVSGLLGFRVLSGAKVRLRVSAEPEAAPLEQALAPGAEETPSAHVYPSPRKALEARYRVGDAWTFIPVGQRPISGRAGAPRLDGNYGVLYDIDLRLENPTDRERTVNVALSPDAGDASGVFWIGGQFVEAPALSPPMDAVLASFRLAPGESRDVPIRTLPVAGSAYPARLVIRATPLPPAATPPPAGSAALR